jgi:hypothetical protein
MKWDEINTELIDFAREQYADDSASGVSLMPHEEEMMQLRLQISDMFSMILLPHEEEMLQLRRQVAELFSQPQPLKGNPLASAQSTDLRTALKEQPIEPPKKEKPQMTLSEPKKAYRLKEKEVIHALPEKRDDTIGLAFNLEGDSRTLSLRPQVPKRGSRSPRILAASLVAGCTLFAAALGYPPTRRMILELIGFGPGQVEAPLIPASNSAEANQLRKRIDNLRIDPGAFSGCYRLQANDNRVNWYFDNLGLIASCQTKPSWVRDYLARYLSNVDQSTGTIKDVEDISTAAFQPSDSDAPYAATMLSLAARCRRTSDQQWTVADLTLFKQIARKTILAAQKPNGLVKGKIDPQADAICRLMDNCEVYRGLADFSEMLARDDDADAKEFADAATRVAAGIAGLYDERLKAFKAADVDAGEKFYPYRAAQIFPEVYGVPLGDQARTAERYEAAWNFLNATDDRWDSGEVKDGSLQGYPWMILGYAAAKHGKPELARKQLAYFQKRLNESSDPKFTAIHELGWAVRTIDLLEYNEKNK